MARIRRTAGRQKIEIKKISKESNLYVTFSKRHNGIFKKASELCTLCAAEVAVIIFSPGNKVFSFGHPNVNDVLNRLIHGAPPQNVNAMPVIETLRSANLRNLNANLTQFSNALEMERKRTSELNKLLNPVVDQFWWAGPTEEMAKPQLESLLRSMGDMKRAITAQADMMWMSSNQSQFSAGSSSNLVTSQPSSQQWIQPSVVPANYLHNDNMIPPPNHGFSNLG